MKTLAIDQGTTSTRALVLDPTGEMTPLLSLLHRQSYPSAGRVEHDPRELFGNMEACLRAAEELSDVTSVGIANQGESCLAWNADSLEPISPVIVWQDGRTSAEIERIRGAGLATFVRDRSGLPLDPYFSATKLGWILREVAAARALLNKDRLCLGTTDAFFRHRLTGRFETDITTASRTSLMNLTSCDWDLDLCRLFGVPVEALPRITPSSGDLGSIKVGNRRLPLRASLVDQQAALYGHGCRAAGDAKITFGTGAFALAVAGATPQLHATRALPTVAWQKAGERPVYALDGGIYAAASAVNWAGSLGLFKTFNDINSFAAGCAAERGLVFVPALAGLACPHWNRAARGAWMGLSHDTSRADMMQAVLEGIAFRMSEVVAEIDKAAPLCPTISIDGGMSGNPWFCQFLADVLGRTLVVQKTSELTALGAAQLAAEVSGLHTAKQDVVRTIRPNAPPDSGLAAFRRAREAVELYGLGGGSPA